MTSSVEVKVSSVHRPTQEGTTLLWQGSREKKSVILSLLKHPARVGATQTAKGRHLFVVFLRKE